MFTFEIWKVVIGFGGWLIDFKVGYISFGDTLVDFLKVGYEL